MTNLDRRDFTLETIVEAIATYGMRVRPHLGSLIELGEELEAYDADDNDPLALDSWRKQSIIRTILRLSEQFETRGRRLDSPPRTQQFSFWVFALLVSRVWFEWRVFRWRCRRRAALEIRAAVRRCRRWRAGS